MQIIAGKFKNQKLYTPKSSLTRPTSSMLRGSLFNICQNYIEDAYFLDLFAGSGAIGFEALSRGAKHVTFIDASKEATRAIEENAKKFNVLNQVQILHGDVFEHLLRLQKKEKQFDIIYADPPYDAYKNVEHKQISFSALVLKMIDESKLLKETGDLFIEDSVTAKPNEEALLSLSLKNSRKFGRSCLLHFTGRTLPFQ